ncbi:MAG: protein TolR [Alphaproteobacteria bacterium]|nr:protein TolR [Alphaproteobacteria bacterium]
MGASIGGGRGGGRRRTRPVSDINVTPMVDVMLVLLVIFMVTAPLLTAGVDVNLPKATDKPLKGENNEVLSVSIQADGRIFLQKTEVPLDELAPRIKAVVAAKPDTRIFVRGDEAAPYGRFLQVFSNLRDAGLTKVDLVSAPTKAAR